MMLHATFVAGLLSNGADRGRRSRASKGPGLHAHYTLPRRLQYRSRNRAGFGCRARNEARKAGPRRRAKHNFYAGRWCSAGEWEDIMKTRYTVALSMVAGAALGGAAIQGLHAQAKPPVHYVAEIDVTNPDAYAKEYAPKAQALIK